MKSDDFLSFSFIDDEMFGYPFFTQDDPRDVDEETIEKYDILLFQLDSEYNKKIGD